MSVCSAPQLNEIQGAILDSIEPGSVPAGEVARIVAFETNVSGRIRVPGCPQPKKQSIPRGISKR